MKPKWKANDGIELGHKQAKDYALRCLGRRSLFSAELVTKLLNRGASSDTTQQIVEACQRAGYLNDEEWVRSFVRQCKIRCEGPHRISAKLQAHGVPRDMIVNAVREMKAAQEPQENEQAIRRLLTTRYHTRDLANPRERQKVVAALFRKGFSFDDIKKALSGKFVQGGNHSD